MSEHVKCNAIILYENPYGEADKMLTAFSDEFGKISVSAKGAKKTGSRFLAVSQQFCYSRMELSYAKNGIYTLCEGELISSFYNIRTDYDVLTVAEELVRLTARVAQEECKDENILRLLLNALSFLTVKGRNLPLVYNAFAIRLVYDQGFFEPQKTRLEGTSQALAHIIGNDYGKLFCFDVSDTVLSELSAIAKKAVELMLAY